MKILAIDIGTAHIKSVIVETKFKRFDIVLHDITSVPDAWQPRAPGSEQLLSDGQLATLAEIRQRYGEGVDRIVTNLPFSLYSSRFQTFPMKEKRKVLSAIRFAIEDEIPFDLDDCVVTSQIYPARLKETDVLTGFAPIDSLGRFVESLSAMGLSPDCLMMEEAALAAQFERAKSESYKNVAVLNLGHRKSGMFFFSDGMPVLHRNTMMGGYQVTEAIASRYTLGLAEAELAKVDRGFLAVPGMTLTADQEAFSETIRGALEPVFADFQQSMMAYSSRFNKDVDAIYICGGTSLLPGIAEYLSKRWGKKVMAFQPTKLFPALSIQPQRNVEVLLPLATALGLTQAAGDGRSTINFRSGALASLGGGLSLNFQQFVYPAKLALTVYLVAMVSVIGQSVLLGKQITAKDDQLSRAIRTVLGGVPSGMMAALKSNPVKLKASVEKKVQEYQALVKTEKASVAGNKSIDFLQDLSKAVPKSVTTEIRQLDYTPTKVSLVMESPSQSAAEAALSTLQSLPVLQNPKASPLETKGTRKRFTISAMPNPKRGG
jgi:type IV pilus assembly protein PilM